MIVAISPHHQQCDNFHKLQKGMAKLASCHLCVVLHWPFHWCPSCKCVSHYLEGKMGSVQHKVACCYGVCQYALLCSSLSSSLESLGELGLCATWELEHCVWQLCEGAHSSSLTISAPVQSQCHFLTCHCSCPQSVQVPYCMSAASFSSL